MRCFHSLKTAVFENRLQSGAFPKCPSLHFHVNREHDRSATIANNGRDFNTVCTADSFEFNSDYSTKYAFTTPSPGSAGIHFEPVYSVLFSVSAHMCVVALQKNTQQLVSWHVNYSSFNNFCISVLTNSKIFED